MNELSEDTKALLPLHPLAFRVLLVLIEGSAHGYRIIKEIEDKDGGWIRIFPANLYRRIRDLLAEGLVEETDAPRGELDDPRRRYFRITARGRAIARLEAQRITELATDARASLGRP